MRLSVVFLCLLLATLSLAAIPSPAKSSSLSRKKHRKPPGKKGNGGTLSAAGRSSQTTKKPVRDGSKVSKKHLKKRVGATEGLEKTSAGAGKKSSAVSGSGKGSQEGGVAQDGRSKLVLNFPKALVELIGEYLDSSYSVVFTRNWSAAYNEDSVAVDNERHYLITKQIVQASSHSGGEQVSIGSPDLFYYNGFQSSHDGCSLFFTGKTKEQASSVSFAKTARWLVQDTDTKSLKGVTLESGESFFAGYDFMLSANGKTLVCTHFYDISNTWTTSVYQIKKHGKTALASKKANSDGEACAVSGSGNRVLLKYRGEKEHLEIHDISGDGSSLVLEINYAEAYVGSCALNSDGSKAAFIYDNDKLYIVDVNKEEGIISLDQLTPIDIPDSVIDSGLIYDAKDRLHVFEDGDLWLVDPLKREFVSLEKAQVPQGYWVQSSAISPNIDYIALLIRSKDKNENGERQYRMVVKGDPKSALMHLCGH